jgi:hypothetical protein
MLSQKGANWSKGCVPQCLHRARSCPLTAVSSSAPLYKQTLRELDRLLFPRVQGYPGGNQARAALLLGISRRILHQKPRELGLHVTPSVEANEGDLPEAWRAPPRNTYQSRLATSWTRNLCNWP